MREPCVLVGSNLAVLATAVELGTAGRDVVLLTDGRPLGGHFRGLRTPAGDFDLGMVLLETVPGAAGVPELAGFRPRVRHDWTRFGDLAHRWQRQQVQLRRTPTPEVLVEGRRWPDHLIANRLDVLADGGFAPPPPLAREHAEHPAGKNTAPAYDELSYADAAGQAHGEEIHRRLVEPFATKVLGEGGTALLARHHRAGWLPLYWPETLTAACAGQPTGLAEYPFWTTASGFVGDLVATLEARAHSLPTVTVHRTPLTSAALRDGRWEWRAVDAGGPDQCWASARPVLGLPAERLAQLAGLPVHERVAGASVVLLCCLVRSAAIGAPVGCLSVVDAEVATHRVTDQDVLAGRDPEWHRVVVEAGPATAALSTHGLDVAGLLVAELHMLLDLRPPDPAGTGADVQVVRLVAAPGAVPIPTAAALATDDTAHDERVAALPGALFTGALLGMGSASMNDQIVQALAITEELR